MQILKKGSRGSDVKELQRRLHLLADGVFGKLTEEAVREFQREHGLKVDGIVGDATWKAMEGTATFGKSRRRIDEIIVHCTASPEGQDKTVAQIRNDHMRNRGFSDIGYHYVVYRDGSVHVGRNVNLVGAHCTGHNTYSIGVAYVGGVENKQGVPYNQLKAKDTRTNAQKASLRILLQKLRTLYPKAKILGHRDTSPDKNGNGVIEPWEWLKECPSFDAKKEYSSI